MLTCSVIWIIGEETLVTTHETAKESLKEVLAPRGINSDKDSSNNNQDNEENQEVLIPIDEGTGKNLMIFDAPNLCFLLNIP